MPASLKNLIFTIIGIAFLAGCATVDTGYHIADTVAFEHHFTKDHIKTRLCNITSFYHFDNLGAPLTVYIEGDGFAWRSRRELSDDPTPRYPLVLSLAATDPSENVAYLARPGQLTASGSPDCDPAYWSEKRFSREVVSAINSSLDYLKAKSQSKEINIIGYSGGAALAIILAAKRNDVISIRTIAGNLDHRALCKYHRVSFLDSSLNPIDYASSVKRIPQRHFIGSEDIVVPEFIAQSFVEREGDNNHDRIIVVKGATHTKGWQKCWKELLSLPLL